MYAPQLLLAAYTALVAIFLARVILRPHRDPASRIAWVAVITSVPLVGIAAYVLFGEVNIGRRRVDRLRAVLAQMPGQAECAVGQEGDDGRFAARVPRAYEPIFSLGESISGFAPVGGNSARLLADSNATIDALVADIDAAEEHVHLLFYIWLPDNNGGKVVEALKRAAARGVTCRAMVDGLGSRLLLKSPHWKQMRAAGVQLAVALPIGNVLLRPLHGRVDLRNHRKIVVIDGRITYCGSQNCADPEFRIKARYAPWVDAVMRFEGPIARQNQYLFASDWMSCTNDDLGPLLLPPIPAPREGFPAQVIGTGPTNRVAAMPQVFESLIFAAHRQLTITTPYYVPDESMQSALCASAYRGVDTTIVFPARNDSWIVGGASRSYYPELLEAGVTIYEYVGGLLHTKSVTVDGELALIGSANMDRRSFDLNYENNILFQDRALTADLLRRQRAYISRSRQVLPEEVNAWPLHQRLRNNALAMLGPIL